MSVRNALVLLLAVSTIAFLVACGGGNGKTNPVAPPSGGFNKNNLNGTYVFSVSGTDESGTGASYAMVGTFTADGNGGISGGTFDINDNNTTEFSTGPIIGATINSGGSYSVTVDGRGQATFSTSISGFPKVVLDFVLSSNTQGLVTEFDTFGTGSGTIDAQTASVTPAGAYAFSLSGATFSGSSFATVGNFTLGAGGAITPGSGLADFNNGALTISTAQALTGSVVAAPSSTASTLSTQQYPSLAFDVYPIDTTHLKFVEIDENGTLSGDAYSQTSTAIPAETLAFTLAGEFPVGAGFAGGGFIVTDGAGNITNSSNEDYNGGGTLSPTTPVAFTGTYTADNTDPGRYTLTTAGFSGGTTFAAYPSSGGVLLLEIDPAGVGLTLGAAYPTTANATFDPSEGYGLNLAGGNLTAGAEVDDIAEFTANSSGATIIGLIDENSSIQSLTFDSQLSGTYVAPSGGRGAISATAGTNSSNTTLEGGFDLIFYTVDGTTFPFIEFDSDQIATGVFVKQASSSSSAVARQHMFVTHSLFHPHASNRKQ